MGARAGPESPRGQPVTHERPRAKRQPWERAVPSTIRTSGVSGHFIHSSPQQEVTRPLDRHHPSCGLGRATWGHPREGRPGDTATLPARGSGPSRGKSRVPPSHHQRQDGSNFVTALGGAERNCTNSVLWLSDTPHPQKHDAERQGLRTTQDILSESIWAINTQRKPWKVSHSPGPSLLPCTANL